MMGEATEKTEGSREAGTGGLGVGGTIPRLMDTCLLVLHWFGYGRAKMQIMFGMLGLVKIVDT